MVEYLVYATPDHPEYRRYPLKDILVVQAGDPVLKTTHGPA